MKFLSPEMLSFPIRKIPKFTIPSLIQQEIFILKHIQEDKKKQPFFLCVCSAHVICCSFSLKSNDEKRKKRWPINHSTGTLSNDFIYSYAQKKTFYLQNDTTFSLSYTVDRKRFWDFVFFPSSSLLLLLLC